MLTVAFYSQNMAKYLWILYLTHDWCICVNMWVKQRRYFGMCMCFKLIFGFNSGACSVLQWTALMRLSGHTHTQLLILNSEHVLLHIHSADPRAAWVTRLGFLQGGCSRLRGPEVAWSWEWPWRRQWRADRADSQLWFMYDEVLDFSFSPLTLLLCTRPSIFTSFSISVWLHNRLSAVWITDTMWEDEGMWGEGLKFYEGTSTWFSRWRVSMLLLAWLSSKNWIYFSLPGMTGMMHPNQHPL